MILSNGISSRFKLTTIGMSQGFLQSVWVVNASCPVPASVLFPQGLPDFEFIDVTDPPYPSLKKGDKKALQVGCTKPVVVNNAIQFRGHHPGSQPFSLYAPRLQQFVAETEGPIAVLADSQHAAIAAILGDRYVQPASVEMVDDMDRSPEQIQNYLTDWWRYLKSHKRLTNYSQSAANWSLTVNLTTP
jgi:hypothetical protein